MTETVRVRCSRRLLFGVLLVWPALWPFVARGHILLHRDISKNFEHPVSEKNILVAVWNNSVAHGSNAVVWSYTYDALNRMVTATKACPTCDALTVRFAYDPFNRRISKTVASGATTSLVQRFLWDRQNEIGAADSSGNLLQLRLLGRGLGNEVGAAVALEIRTNAASAWVAYVPIHDHRGNMVVLLNRSTGAVAEYYRYDAFGNVLIYSPAHSLLPDSAVGNPWRFASKRADVETGFVYFGRRLYDPQLGRFVTCDPLGFLDGPNRYLFAQATPLGMTDFDGLLARQLGHSVAGWADANFSLVNDDWRYIPTMNDLDWSGWSDYLPAAIQNMLFAPIWNLVAGTANPFIDIKIYGSDSEYAPYFFAFGQPEIGVQMEYTMQAMGPLVQATVGRVGQWFSKKPQVSSSQVPPQSAPVFERGVTVVPRSTANEYRLIMSPKAGRAYVTQPESVESIIGPLQGNRIVINRAQAHELQQALGLQKPLESRNIIYIIDDIPSRAPSSPLAGNDLFVGPGAGLPGGGGELTIQPMPSAGGQGISQIILEVQQ